MSSGESLCGSKFVFGAGRVFLKRSAITEAVYSKDGNCAMKIIITGTAGFIGPPVCRHPPRKTNAEFARRPEVVAT
jgi:hypothetical protein